jgi:hypothetical protein
MNLPARLFLVLLLSLVLSTAMVLESPNPGATLDPLYTDSLRSIYSSWLFLEYGFDVYRFTLGELAGREGSPPGHTPWPQHPFVYPPGALLLYLPFGWAEYGLGLPEAAVHRAVVLLCVILGHLSLAVFVRELVRGGGSLALVLGGLYAMVALQFALNGFYDPAYVAAAMLGVVASRRGERSQSLLWLAVAAFLHFRALFFLPIALRDLGGLGARAARRQLARSEGLALVLALALAAAAAWSLLLTWKSFDDTTAANLILEEDFGWGGAVVVSAATLGAAFYLFRSGDRMAGLGIGWAGALTLALPFSRAWHSLALYPFLLLVSPEGRKREVVLLWLLVVSSIAFRYFPSLRWLARGLGLLFD